MSQKGAYELLLDKIENACSVLSNLIDKTEKDVFDFSKISLEFKDRIESDYRNTSSYLKDWFTRYIYFKDDQMVLITGQVLRNRHDRIHTLLYQHERAGEAHLYQSDAKKCLSCCSVDGVNYEYRILVTRLKKAKYEQVCIFWCIYIFPTIAYFSHGFDVFIRYGHHRDLKISPILLRLVGRKLKSLPNILTMPLVQ